MKRSSHGSPESDKRSFTLIEMLVAMVIFLILIVLTAQVFNAVSRSILGQQQRMDSLGEARFALDRLSLDWSARVKRPDVTGSFLSQPGNDQISFVSQVPAFTGTRDMSVVTYRIGTNSTTGLPELDRGVLGYNLFSTDSAPENNPLLTFPFTGVPTITSAADFEQISQAVFRIEFCFLTQPNGSSTSLFTTHSLNLNSTNFAGIVVAVAALDLKSQKILTAAQMATLTSALPDVANGVDPQSLWLQQINSSTFAATAGVPVVTAGAVRVYQRVLLNSQ
jgi:prepilin-type N-terminal cleavage/methylation domain-containing protein